jgi:hypothetical protein
MKYYSYDSFLDVVVSLCTHKSPFDINLVLWMWTCFEDANHGERKNGEETKEKGYW